MMKPEIINKNIWDRLKKIYERGLFSGAYLFVGAKSLGKLDLALEFIFLDKKLNDKKNLVLKGGHSDVVILKPQIEEKNGKVKEKQISLEETQEAIKKFNYCLAEAENKFLIIQSAEKLTHQASNSLLKIVEELPPNYVIILLTSEEESVLKTVQSRCQKVYFNLKNNQEIEKFLVENNDNLKQNELTDVVFLSRGRIKEAQKYLENKEYRLEKLKKIEKFKQALRGDLRQGFEIAKNDTQNKEDFIEDLDNWIYYLNNFLKQNIFEDKNERVQKKVFEITQKITKGRQLLAENPNTNTRLLVENFFVQIK